jgi:hypothetical protein
MKIRELRDNCDGKGPQLVETEVPDSTPEEIAARQAKRDERMKAREPKPAQA